MNECQEKWTKECLGSVCKTCGFCQGHAWEANRQGEGRCPDCEELNPDSILAPFNEDKALISDVERENKRLKASNMAMRVALDAIRMNTNDPYARSMASRGIEDGMKALDE